MDDSLGVIGGVSRSMDGQIAIWLEHLGTFVANNAAPLPRDLSLERESDKGIRIAVAKLLQAAHDADGDVLALERFDAISSNGGSVQNVSDWLLYEPPLNNVSDSFTYTISDSEGAIGEGTIFITIWEDEQSPTQNMTSVVVQGDQVIVRFVGIPGVKYQIERTNSLSKPEWQAMHIAAAAPNGRFEVRDTRLEGQMRFYRAIVAPEE